VRIRGQRETARRLLGPLLLAGVAALTSSPAVGSAPPPDGARLEALAAAAAGRSWELLRELLAIPNDAHFPQEHLRPNLAYVREAFEARSFEVVELETAGFPLLLAERPADDRPTVLVYLQIDGQPVDPSRWEQADPWQPVLKRRSGPGWEEIPWDGLHSPGVDPEWRVFARSASDAKGPVAMFLTALDVLDAEGLEPSVGLKVIMDFEEELGSPHLPAAVERHRAALEADALVIFDGPLHYSNRPSLTFGARGIATIELVVFGPVAPLHSGHYGNWAPNPAQRLAELLASMKDAAGRVVIAGFYDGVELDDETLAILREVPDDEEEILRRLGVARPDGVAPTYQESIQYPSLNVRGMAAGWVGEQVRTIVPSEAVAEIDVRLTPESDPERLVGLIRDHVVGRGYHLVAGGEPTDAERARYPLLARFSYDIAYQAFRTPFEAPVGRWLTAALRRAFGEAPVRQRMSGGSIPIAPFVTTVGLPAVTVPTVNADNNQHSPNENLRVGNYVDGIRTYLAVLTEPFED
jgi:acetylornithine deacetylase/succinyl-diaminopimelate desuccinylase-like protein